MRKTSNELEHYGVLGMKWGHRKGSSTSTSTSTSSPRPARPARPEKLTKAKAREIRREGDARLWDSETRIASMQRSAMAKYASGKKISPAMEKAYAKALQDYDEAMAMATTFSRGEVFMQNVKATAGFAAIGLVTYGSMRLAGL